MTKLCPRGKAAAKRKFKVYPSAYANAYASKICAGKIKDPSGVKRKDFKGPKPASAKQGKFMNEIEIERAMRETLKRNRRRHHNRLMDKLQAEIEQVKINEQKFLRGFGKGAKKLKNPEGFNVGGHSVMGSPVSVDVDGDTLSNPSASAYYKDLLK